MVVVYVFFLNFFRKENDFKERSLIMSVRTSSKNEHFNSNQNNNEALTL